MGLKNITHDFSNTLFLSDIDGVLINENNSFRSARNQTLYNLSILDDLSDPYYCILDHLIETVKTLPGLTNEQIASLLTLSILKTNSDYQFPHWVKIPDQSLKQCQDYIRKQNNLKMDAIRNSINNKDLPDFNLFLHCFEHVYYSPEIKCSDLSCKWDSDTYLSFHKQEKVLLTIPLSHYFPNICLITTRLNRETQLAIDKLSFNSPVLINTVSIDTPPCKPYSSALLKILDNTNYSEIIYVGDSIDDIEFINNIKRHLTDAYEIITFYFITNKCNNESIKNSESIVDYKKQSINDVILYYISSKRN